MKNHLSIQFLIFCSFLFVNVNTSDCIKNWQLPEEQQQINTNNTHTKHPRQPNNTCSRTNSKEQYPQSLSVTKYIQKKTRRY